MRRRRVQRLLFSAPAPDELAAGRRAWRVVRAAFEAREPVRWPRRHARALASAAAAVAVLAGILTSPGRALVDSVRDAIGREKVVGVPSAHRAIFRLPSGGRLLVESPRGVWIVRRDGARRLLGPYRMASWSAHGRFVAAVRGRSELLALDTRGNVRWSKPRKQRLAYPRWSFEGYRIAYFSGRTLRVIVGDGTGDRGLGTAEPSVPPAWRPGFHEVAFVGSDGSVRIAESDRRRVVARARGRRGEIRQLLWSADGQRLLVVERLRLRVLLPRGRQLASAQTPGRTSAASFAPRGHRFALVVRARRSSVLVGDADELRRATGQPVFGGAGRFDAVAWSPDGRWLLVSWPDADQWVFLRLGGRPKLEPSSNVARQFDPGSAAPRFPRLGTWCCAPP